MKGFTHLSPVPLWGFFSEILEIPRPSKKEGKMITYLMHFAEKHNLQAMCDETGNVLISKPAAKGREHLPVVVLQTHMDMVCEKNEDKHFDFSADPIEAVIGEEWISANGTTLGADDGIGIAAQLAVLASDDIKHGPIECLFTVDEETGLTGANALQPGFISGRFLINLDSEDEGEIFIGCAGGMDTVAWLKYKSQPVPAGFEAVRIRVTGLQGGHSGDDIHKGFGNAIKILVRFLDQVRKKQNIRLSELNGGNLRNAIAREGQAILVADSHTMAKLMVDFERYKSAVKLEYERIEPDLVLFTENVPAPSAVLDPRSCSRLLDSLMGCPHGVLEWSSRMPGMVETSTNLASVKFKGKNRIEVTTSQRSEIESRKIMAAAMVEAVFRLAGAEVSHSDGYPGWTPNPGSPLLKTAVESYKKLFHTQPVVRSIHAGLECGLFLEKNPALDMISIGPTIKGVHSPGERINIETVSKFWAHLIDILENLE